jgi:hypothetical protein
VRARAVDSRSPHEWYPRGVEYTPEMRAMLEAQRAYFASDDHIRREVAMWTDSTPEERLAAAAKMCAAGYRFLLQTDHETLARIQACDAMPADTLAILAALRGS